MRCSFDCRILIFNYMKNIRKQVETVINEALLKALSLLIKLYT